MTDDDRDAQLAAQMRDAQEAFLAGLPQRLLALERAWASALTGWSAETCATALRDAHSLHGTAAMLGFEEIAEAAGRLEEALAGFPSEEGGRAEIGAALARLKSAAG